MAKAFPKELLVSRHYLRLTATWMNLAVDGCVRRCKNRKLFASAK